MELKAFVAITLLCGMTVSGSMNDSTTDSGQTSSKVTATTSHTNPPSVTTSAPSPLPCEAWRAQFSGESRYCIIIQADLNVTINYNNTITEIHVNRSSKSHGDCSSSTSQKLNILNDVLELHWNFEETVDTRKFNLTSIDIFYKSNISGTVDMNGLWLSNLDKNKTFQCNAMKTASGTSGTSNFTIKFSNLKLEAFQNTPEPCFSNRTSNYDICQDDTTVSNLVPIIVGACLGGLIVIVLVAYLIGRRRSRRGYESV